MSKASRFRKVAVVKGGPSSEREVSLRSGAAVARGLREAGYDVVEMDLTGRTVDLPRDIEAVFIALHGEFGEDGQVQRLLEEKGIPYTGSSPEASALAFDKMRTKEILRGKGILTPRYEVLAAGGRRTIDLPVVVKPSRQGSSIGVHRVFREEEWALAFADALRYDSELIVEEYIRGRELTVGVVGEQVLPAVEIVAPGDWYSYDAKYSGGKTKYIAPAPLSAGVADMCAVAALQTFRALGCRGMGRVDFRLSPDTSAFVLELNSIPGFTETSLLPKAAQAAGISFPELCAGIMELAALGR